ncbi:hypothetical protein FE257_006831 [Aspergillus nanangensis]|uniref:Uncharacterized protein n=1 Tax=Aspergillus nanangensis TaxID=2582783 RepID=A0AAD4CP89_ASPNN|nr:hypothetical protein FE257_006831 [Aspergillus nanangensis]
MTAHSDLGKSSWSRLKPVKDPLDAVGFVSKGDQKLRDLKAQENYFSQIKQRYLEFCARHTGDLDAAWASLPTSASGDATKNPPASIPGTSVKSKNPSSASASAELSVILLSLRKLREAVLSTSSQTSASFSQHVHIFSIKLSIRAKHPPSYYPSLRYLLEQLHTPSHPVPQSELNEFVSYIILDYACRQEDLVSAFEWRARARSQYSFQSSIVDRVLAALAHDNWIVFWGLRKEVDSLTRAIMDWAEDRVRRRALQAVGSAYPNVGVKWITEGCTGDKTWTWERLADVEKLGWQREGDKIIIKKPRLRPGQPLQPAGGK